MTRRFCAISLVSAFLFLGLAGGGRADTRTVEEVGAVPFEEGASSRQAVRKRALELALRNAVLRVAAEMLSAEGVSEFSERQLKQALGSKSMEYVARYRIVEDRGEGAAVFSTERPGGLEYVVVVRVEVDEGLVRARLAAAGWGVAEPSVEGGQAASIVVEGVEGYDAYAALVAAIGEQPGVAGVTPRTFQRGRVELLVDGRSTAPELIERLAANPRPGLQVVPVRGSGAQNAIRIFWRPPKSLGEGNAAGASRTP